MKKIYKNIIGDSLYRNSSYLIASNILSTALGFIFWALATRVFSTQDVGLGSTLISSTDLVVAFALLGLNMGLVRYLPASDRKNDKINSVFVITSITSLIASLIFVLGLRYISPELVIIHDSLLVSVMFIIFVVFLSLAESIKSIFRAYRSSQYVLIKNTIFNFLKIILIIIFVNLGALGIFSSWLVSLVISCIVSLIILTKKFNYEFKPIIKIDVTKKIFLYSFANYVSEFLERAPKLAMPLIITSIAGPQNSAYYYIDMSIATFLFMLPEAIASSFFAETSTNEAELALNTKKALKAFCLVLIPAVIGIMFLGNYILLFFGKEYSTQGSELLKLLSLSTVFIAINALFSNIVRINGELKKLILINFLGAVTILGLSLILINLSLVGIGWAWLIGNTLMSLFYLATSRYKS